jgi:WD40 repeat protein
LPAQKVLIQWLLVVISVLVLSLPGCKRGERLTPATTEGLVATLDGHTDGITCVVFSPDGTTLASGSLDATVRLWDITTGEETATLRGHPDQVNAVAFSPDGTLLASGNGTFLGSTGDLVEPGGGTPYMLRDGTPMPLPNKVILWDVTTGTERMRWEGFKTAIWTVAFSPDGKTLAAGSGTPAGMFDDAVRLWDVATGELKVRLKQHTGTVGSIAFSPDGVSLAVGSLGGITLWDVETNKSKASLGKDTVRSVALSPDGVLLASGTSYDIVRLWNTETGQEQAVLDEHDGTVYALAFSPDGTMLASAGQDGTVHLWDVTTTDKVAAIRIPQTWVGGVAFSPDGTLLATGSSDGLIRLWNVAEVLRR